MRRVIVYSGADPRKNQSSLFFLHLFWAIMERGRKAGYDMVPLIDTRPQDNRYGPPPEFQKIKDAGKVDGCIAFMLFPTMVDWVIEEGIPLTALSGNSKDVVFNMAGMVEESIRRLAFLGCKSMGLMIPVEGANSDVLEMLDELANELDVSINYERIVVSREAMETKGYHHFESLWDLKSHPDGLLIYPDVTARGVVSAIVERRVRVPQDLKLVLHRNAQSPFVVPFPCDWVEIDVDPVADSLLEVIRYKWEGREFVRKLVPFKLVTGESD